MFDFCFNSMWREKSKKRRRHVRISSHSRRVCLVIRLMHIALTEFRRNREDPRAPRLTESNYEGPPRADALLDREFHFRPWRVAIKRTFDGLWDSEEGGNDK